MTKKERFYQLINSESVTDTTLFTPILMHFAARYAGKTYGEFVSNYEALAESNIKCLDDFDFDAVSLISDPYRETAAFGSKVTFLEEAVPRCKEHIINSMQDIEALKNPNVYKSERTLDRIKGAELLSRKVGATTPVIGWIEGPLAEACDLAGVNEILLNLMIQPDFVKCLIDKVMITAKDFAKAQIEAGCDIIGVGDAICSQISTDLYQEFVKEKHAELFEFIHEQGAKVKLHICGDITHLLNDIKETKPDIVDLDHLVDTDKAFELLGKDIVRCGNLDPVSIIQNKKPNEIEQISNELISSERGRKFVLSGGCEIPVATPKENLKAMRLASSLN